MEHVIMPELGEGIEKATIACWHVIKDAPVNRDDDIVEVVTDKATFNVPAGVTGVIKEINFNEGDEVRIGEVLARIEAA